MGQAERRAVKGQGQTPRLKGLSVLPKTSCVAPPHQN